MSDPPPPSYDDAITGNFSDEPPPPPSSNAEISVSTSFLGPERYKAPETIVPFPSSPEPITASLPPSPEHTRSTTPRITPTTTFNNRPSSSATVVTVNNNENSSSPPNKSQCIKLVAFIMCILIGIGVLYFVLSGPAEETEYYDSYDEPKVYRTTTTTSTTPRPSTPDDCKTKPPQIVEKRGFGSFKNNCWENHKGEYYNKTICIFQCTGGHILSSSPGVLDAGYVAGYPETQIMFTCIKSKWEANVNKMFLKLNNIREVKNIKCLSLTEHIRENVG